MTAPSRLDAALRDPADYCSCGKAWTPWHDRRCPTGFICQCCSGGPATCWCVPEGEPQWIVCCSSGPECDGR
ncbi:MAG: hypothetical protein FJ087_07425 [Deltaproteobacteria bacterium]|nr:hypothetical protein [Deltaproteobacteria bacterium]